MPLTPEETMFKEWLGSDSCLNYWVIDPLSQEPKLIKGWGKAQVEYDRIKNKEKIPLSPKSLKDKTIQ